MVFQVGEPRKPKKLKAFLVLALKPKNRGKPKKQQKKPLENQKTKKPKTQNSGENLGFGYFFGFLEVFFVFLVFL